MKMAALFDTRSQPLIFLAYVVLYTMHRIVTEVYSEEVVIPIRYSLIFQFLYLYRKLCTGYISFQLAYG